MIKSIEIDTSEFPEYFKPLIEFKYGEHSAGKKFSTSDIGTPLFEEVIIKNQIEIVSIKSVDLILPIGSMHAWYIIDIYADEDDLILLKILFN